MKKGFTLIELLVVVLIIGILSAVALPQYTKAVEKARAAEALVLLRNIADANNRYYMSNGEFTWDLTNLDIDIPGDSVAYEDMQRKQTKYFLYGARATSSTDTTNVIAIANRIPADGFYSLRIFAHDRNVYCRGYNEEGDNVCKRISGAASKSGSYYVLQ
ncbi:type IV pilin protein [Candidatus Avelusimicrobium sp.]